MRRAINSGSKALEVRAQTSFGDSSKPVTADLLLAGSPVRALQATRAAGIMGEKTCGWCEQTLMGIKLGIGVSAAREMIALTRPLKCRTGGLWPRATPLQAVTATKPQSHAEDRTDGLCAWMPMGTKCGI